MNDALSARERRITPRQNKMEALELFLFAYAMHKPECLWAVTRDLFGRGPQNACTCGYWRDLQALKLVLEE